METTNLSASIDLAFEQLCQQTENINHLIEAKQLLTEKESFQDKIIACRFRDNSSQHETFLFFFEYDIFRCIYFPFIPTIASTE